MLKEQSTPHTCCGAALYGRCGLDRPSPLPPRARFGSKGGGGGFEDMGAAKGAAWRSEELEEEERWVGGRNGGVNLETPLLGMS